ncbi:MAG: hypothetical protein MUO72_05990 [Bacteroidales bacterium]|nr:hypothetical protein [Bacteroidales bacterium]
MDEFNINPGLGFNSGFILKILNNFSISAEIIPQLLFEYTSVERIDGPYKVRDTNMGGSFNLSNNSVRVSLIYAWN